MSTTTPMSRGTGHRGSAILVGALLALSAAPALAQTTAPAPPPVKTPSPPQPSSIGDRQVAWITVSPAFTKSGLAVAVAQDPKCSKDCTHLWVTEDGGATWHRAQGQGWSGGFPSIGVDSAGQETVFAGTPKSTERSTDDGETWSPVGTGGGMPTPMPSYATDRAVAVAGDNNDYITRSSGIEKVTGSGGSLYDMSFMFAPGFPAAGSQPPALLAAADRNSGLPVIQQCDVHLACHGATTLSGAMTYSIPVTLLPSTTYATDRTVFAQSGRGLYKSTDAGATFVPLNIGQPGAQATATPGLALTPGYSESGGVRTAYAAVLQVFYDPKDPKAPSNNSGGIFRTDDGGATWRVVGSPSSFDQGATAVAVAPDGRIFGGYTGNYTGLLCYWQGQWRVACPPVGDPSRSNAHTAGRRSAACERCTPEAPSTPAGKAGAAGANGDAAGSGGSNSGGGVAGTVPTASHSKSDSVKLLAPLAGGIALALVLAALGRSVWARRRQRA